MQGERRTTLWTVCVLLVGMFTMTSCYGPFKLTKKLHKWNGECGGPWVNEAVFLGLNFIPAYFFATLGDAIIFNSIEFWTGNNPIDPPAEGGGAPAEGEQGENTEGAKVMTQGGHTVVLKRDDTGTSRRMTVEVYFDGERTDHFTLVAKSDGTFQKLDAGGAVVASATRQSDGSLLFEEGGDR